VDQRILRAYGISCGQIATITKIDEKMMFSGDDAGNLREVRRLMIACNINTDPNKSSGISLEAYCRTLCVDNFAEKWDPPVPQEPPYQHCFDLIISALNSDTDSMGQLLKLPFAASFLGQARQACKMRNLFITQEGNIGLAPKAAQPGDEVCVLFGCINPMVVRRVPNSSSPQYRLVGECYTHGMMQGQPILGELPQHIHEVLDRNSVGGLRRAGFLDARTGALQTEDPRLDQFLVGLTNKGILSKPNLGELEERGVFDSLIEAGFPIQTLSII